MNPDTQTASRHFRRARMGVRIVAALVCSLLLQAAVPVQEGGISAEMQSRFLLSVLDYERSLESRAGDEVVIGILYQPLYRASVNVHDAMRSGIDELQQTVPGIRSVTLVSVETGDGSGLEDDLERLGVDVLYIAPLRSISIGVVTALTRQLHVLSFTGVPDYVDRGVCVGVRIREGKPRLLVNREAAASEGVTFSSELLKVAELVEQQDLDQ